MWTFRKKREHIKLETLSEYLDGRLSADVRQKTENHLRACQQCREELESLDYTVGLLRRVPMATPSRSFTLDEGISTAPAPARVRVPSWAYGAAASVAAIFFVALLSVDMGGLLVRDISDTRATQQAVNGTTAPAVSAEQAGDLGEGADQVAAGADQPPQPGTEELKNGASVAPEEDAPQYDEPQGTQVPSLGAQAEEAESKLSVANDEAPPPEPGQAEGGLGPPQTQGPTAIAGAQAPAAEGGPLGPPAAGDAGSTTATIWRVLEGVLGGIALLLVVSILWQRRRRVRKASS